MHIPRTPPVLPLGDVSPAIQPDPDRPAAPPAPGAPTSGPAGDTNESTTTRPLPPFTWSPQAAAVTTTVASAALLALMRTFRRRRRPEPEPADTEADQAALDPIAMPPSTPAEAKSDSVDDRRAEARLGGGQQRIDAQHARGKLTARERIDRLLDPESFEELGPYIEHRHSAFGLDRQRHAGDGVVTGFGRIDGRRVALFAQDFTVLGGSFSETQAIKVGRLLAAATESGLPVIALLDSVGARIQEGIWSLAGFGDLFWRNTQASGVVPQISLMLGPCAGGAVYSPGLTDFVIMVRGSSYMFITGPDVIETVTGEAVDVETLGGAETHAATSGVAHLVADDEDAALDLARRLLAYLPSNNAEDPPAADPDETLEPDVAALDDVLPASAEEAYDVRDVLALVADRGSFLEVHADFAPNAVVGFARIEGRVVAVVANQPSHLAGALDIDASDKIARFIRFSDAFNIPLVSFVDCPGFLPGAHQEQQGIIRHGAKIVYAYAEATVPKVSVVLHKAYGGAYIVMSSKMIRTDVCLAWPTAEVAVMGAAGAVSILYHRRLEATEAPAREAARAELEADFRKQFNSPFVAAAAGHIDDVIHPRETRARIARALAFLRDKQTVAPPKKHGNVPL